MQLEDRKRLEEREGHVMIVGRLEHLVCDGSGKNDSVWRKDNHLACEEWKTEFSNVSAAYTG